MEKENDIKQLTTISNTMNEGKYEIEETEKEKQMYRGLKEKEKELLHLIYYKFNQSENFNPIIMTFNQLADELDIDIRNSAYMKTVVNTMAKLITTFKYGKCSFTSYPIFSKFDYNEKKQLFTVEFNEKLIDFLYCDKDIKLIQKWSEYKKRKLTITKTEAQEFKKKHKGNFTVTSHIELVKLKSSYSMELYEKLSQFKNLEKTKKYTMKELRELLSIPKTYTPSMIKTRIIQKSKEQINEHTTLEIDYEILGSGQKQEVLFSIKEKKQQKKEKETGVDIKPSCSYEQTESDKLAAKQDFTKEEEEMAIKILCEERGVSLAFLKNLKQKMESAYIHTIKEALKNK